MSLFEWNSQTVLMFSIVSIVICETIAQTCLKKSETHQMYVVIAVLLYAFICYLLLVCYRNKGYMGQVNMMWNLMSIISVISVGYLLFNESISINKLIAVALSIGAIYFANSG